MEFFKNLRVKTGMAMLSGKAARLHRKPAFINLENVRTIGIVWDASNIDDFRIISKFYQKMQEKKVDVKILGYFPGKDLPNQYTAIRYLTCLKRQDIDFFYRPVTSEANSFTNFKFDVLIDINFRNLFPLFHVSSLSVAGMKVGLADSQAENLPFDLMISMKNTVNLENYLEQVLYYLEMINSDSVKKAV